MPLPQEPINAYDEVPYSSYPYPQSCPERLATIATLFGMKPAATERCRVLELSPSWPGKRALSLLI